jgi:signal transduction histidine kinase
MLEHLWSNDKAKVPLILTLIAVITGLHNGTSTDYRYLHELFEHLYYVPILLSAFWFGPLVGILFALLTSGLYVVHIHRDWAHFPVFAFDQYMHIFLYHLFAVIIGFLSNKGRRHLKSLEETSQDLSRACKELKRTSARLKRADRLAALGQLSAGIAHEVRNPLGSIKGSIEILGEDISESHPKREFVEIIKNETARLNSLVTEFLRFARPPHPSVESTSLNELLRSAVRLVEREAHESGVEIKWNKRSELPTASVDRDQIRQVLLNLMLNSIQAMPNGGVIELNSRFDRTSDLVEFEIRDEGEGLNKEDLDSIFNPFFTTKPQGTGLGLSVSHQLVQNHGGQITARKNDDRGLTLCVRLPVNSGEAA